MRRSRFRECTSNTHRQVKSCSRWWIKSNSAQMERQKVARARGTFASKGPPNSTGLTLNGQGEAG